MTRPVFVYGTLMPGWHNYDALLAGATTREEPATLAGMVLRDFGAFPYLLPGRGVVQGVLLWLHDPRTLDRVDALEGYFGREHPANHYDRIVVIATTQTNEQIECWTYVAADPSSVQHLPLVPGGVWTADRLSP